MYVGNVSNVNILSGACKKASVNNTRNNKDIAFKQLTPDELKFLHENIKFYPELEKLGNEQMMKLGSILTEATKEASDLRDSVLRGIINKINELKNITPKTPFLQIA